MIIWKINPSNIFPHFWFNTLSSMGNVDKKHALALLYNKTIATLCGIPFQAQFPFIECRNTSHNLPRLNMKASTLHPITNKIPSSVNILVKSPWWWLLWVPSHFDCNMYYMSVYFTVYIAKAHTLDLKYRILFKSSSLIKTKWKPDKCVHIKMSIWIIYAKTCLYYTTIIRSWVTPRSRSGPAYRGEISWGYAQTVAKLWCPRSH